MKFKYVRDALRGKDRRIEELEDALRFILLACDATECVAQFGDNTAELIDNIKEKINSLNLALDKA